MKLDLLTDINMSLMVEKGIRGGIYHMLFINMEKRKANNKYMKDYDYIWLYHRFTCSDICLVYLLSRKVCGRQYTGQTVDEFRYRWNNYKDNNRKSLRGDEHKQAGFFAHFQGLDHNGFLEDTEITFIDKTDPSDPTRREEFWIDTLKTRYPLGLNNIDANH